MCLNLFEVPVTNILDLLQLFSHEKKLLPNIVVYYVTSYVVEIFGNH